MAFGMSLTNEETLADRNEMDVDGFGMTCGIRYVVMPTVGTYTDIDLKTLWHQGDMVSVSLTCQQS